MNALIIGATGATGKDLLQLLLDDSSVNQVDIFVRREIDLQHPKLKVHVIDSGKPENWKHLVKGDVLFSCLGTTLKAAGSKDAQWNIDHTYQFEFAKAAKENHVSTLVLVSALGASSDSFFFYSKMKGQLEADVETLHFSRLIIFKPSILLRKESNRKGETMAINMVKALNAIGMLKAHKPLSTHTLAKAMITTAKSFSEGSYKIKGQEIRKYA